MTSSKQVATTKESSEDDSDSELTEDMMETFKAAKEILIREGITDPETFRFFGISLDCSEQQNEYVNSS